VLREFLYVDTDKVRSLLAQLDEGINEEVQITEKNQTKLSVGAKSILARDQDTALESSTVRSLADAVFPTLEEAMEATGYLVDLSESLQEPTFWEGPLQDNFPAGSFVRITAPARLFDSRYITRIFAGVSATANGFFDLSPELAQPTKGKGLGAPRTKSNPARASKPQPEDEIEDFPPAVFGEEFAASQLRGFAKMTRGMFHPGLHLVLNPAGQVGLAVSARLQEGRRFLESDAEVLFARYGVYEQEWTVVGTIGSHSSSEDAAIDADKPFGARATGIDRAAVTGMVNTMVAMVAGTGFADLPQYPGFSVVPFAVYRPILRSVGSTVADGSAV
jgi:hypothetical protein